MYSFALLNTPLPGKTVHASTFKPSERSQETKYNLQTYIEMSLPNNNSQSDFSTKQTSTSKAQVPMSLLSPSLVQPTPIQLYPTGAAALVPAPPTYELIPNRIFVGGFPSSTTETELREHFEKFYEVKDVKLVKSMDGISKGFGFVTFETEDHAEEVRKLSPKQLEFRGRKLNLGPAIRKINSSPYSSTTGFTIATPSQLVPASPTPYGLISSAVSATGPVFVFPPVGSNDQTKSPLPSPTSQNQFFMTDLPTPARSYANAVSGSDNKTEKTTEGNQIESANSVNNPTVSNPAGSQVQPQNQQMNSNSYNYSNVGNDSTENNGYYYMANDANGNIIGKSAESDKNGNGIQHAYNGYPNQYYYNNGPMYNGYPYMHSCQSSPYYQYPNAYYPPQPYYQQYQNMYGYQQNQQHNSQYNNVDYSSQYYQNYPNYSQQPYSMYSHGVNDSYDNSNVNNLNNQVRNNGGRKNGKSESRDEMFKQSKTHSTPQKGLGGEKRVWNNDGIRSRQASFTIDSPQKRVKNSPKSRAMSSLSAKMQTLSLSTAKK